MPSFIFADTSGWYATLDKNDADHLAAKAFFAKPQSSLITTNLIAGETITLVNNRLGHNEAVSIGKKFWDEEISRLIFVTPEMERLAWNLFQKFDDKRFSFVDCTSFVVMKELGITTAFTFDEHFKQAGFIAIP
ncbi:MAG: type II toxin-antitoxin system VapC family toxin [Deltaproteobacteria bacterium]|nr:type II toxin-antitoxin system VapC family toxin [Deltaproteobacteria bacterium]